MARRHPYHLSLKHQSACWPLIQSNLTRHASLHSQLVSSGPRQCVPWHAVSSLVLISECHAGLWQILACGSMQSMFALWRRAVAPVVRGAHNFLDWRGLAWVIEVRGLASRSEGLANRVKSLSQAVPDRSIKVRKWGPGWPGPCRSK